MDAKGQPHIVPIVYAFDGDRLLTPIDAKPKRVGPYQLQRVRNIQANTLKIGSSWCGYRCVASLR